MTEKETRRHVGWDAYVRGSVRAKPDRPVIQFIGEVLRRIDHPIGLDLGCGGGRHLRYLRHIGVEAVGLDSSQEATRDDRLEVVVCDITDPLPLDDSSFDFVILWGVFVHLPPSEQSDVMDEIFRVLKRGGFFLVDILRPNDFRNALGTPIAENFNESPYLKGVTDYFCEPEEVRSVLSRFELLRERDIGFMTKEGSVAQTCFWLRRQQTTESHLHSSS